MQQKITPFLWFNSNGEEAINFYTSIFKDSSKGNVVRLPEGAPGLDNNFITGSFTICGQRLMVLNGGPMFKFNEAISLFVNCEDQAEVDYYWDKLLEGGTESQCGWLKDKFGLSWQIIPKALGELMHGTDPAKSKRVMEAMLKMKKIIVADLQKAYDQD